MPTGRQLVTAVIALDLLLFLVASALNDHSNTSVDGILWYAALFLFAAMIVVGTVMLGRFLWIRRRRLTRIRGR
jgi:hypothetical protein